MYWKVNAIMMPPTYNYRIVELPACHAGHQMRQLVDRIREKLTIPVGVNVELGYGDDHGGIIAVSDDDSVEEVFQLILQVYRQTLCLIEYIGRVEISPPLITLSGYQRN